MMAQIGRGLTTRSAGASGARSAARAVARNITEVPLHLPSAWGYTCDGGRGNTSGTESLSYIRL
jgi:hypothetical protein